MKSIHHCGFPSHEQSELVPIYESSTEVLRENLYNAVIPGKSEEIMKFRSVCGSLRGLTSSLGDQQTPAMMAPAN